MKKVILSLALLGAAFGAEAQIAAGTKLLSGSIGYSRQQNKQQNSNSPFNNPDFTAQTVNLTPTVGYFVAQNLAVGVNLNFTASKISGQEFGYVYDPANPNFPTPTLYDVKRKSRTINAGVFARYYTFVAEKAAFFGQAGAGYSNVYTNTTTSGRPQGFYGNVLPGFAFFPTDKFALELTLRGLSYNRVSARVGKNGDDKVRNVQNSFDLGVGLQDLRLGAAFYLGR